MIYYYCYLFYYLVSAAAACVKHPADHAIVFLNSLFII
jgi:hypothetical protein